MRNFLRLAIVLLVLPVLGDTSKFAIIQLPLGVSIEVPKNWRLLDRETNETIETAGEAATKLAGLPLPSGKKVNLFRANSNPTTTYCGISINASDSDIKPSDLLKTSTKEIAELTDTLKTMVERGLGVQGLKIVTFSAVRREIIDGHPALTFDYTRTGPQGDVAVQMTRLFIGTKEISLNLSYRKSEAGLWKTLVTYMRSTFKVAHA